MCPKIFHVDAFADRPFTGNPAAVCLLSSSPDEKWMQQVAAEINLSETAFVVPQAKGFSLRWFTPIVEVDTCGHGTLASAHVLWEEGVLQHTELARFHTRAGLLIAEHQDAWIEVGWPVETQVQVAPPTELVVALGVKPLYVGLNRFDYLVEVETEEIVRSISPDLAILSTLPAEGVIVTSRATDPDFDFVSRYFAPRLGISEDPVCGAAHCCLAPYWRSKLAKSRFVAYQASSRGGIIRVHLTEDRVFISGKAITIARGELMSV